MKNVRIEIDVTIEHIDRFDAICRKLHAFLLSMEDIINIRFRQTRIYLDDIKTGKPVLEFGSKERNEENSGLIHVSSIMGEVVNRWNDTYTVGTEVYVTRDKGKRLDTTTLSRAFLVDDGIPAILIKGIIGNYPLSEVQPL